MRKLCEESRSSGTQEVADMADRIEERSDETLPDKYRAVAIAFRLNASAIPATAIADELEALWRAVTSTGNVVMRLGVNRVVAREEALAERSELDHEFAEWWASELGGEPDWGSSRDIDMFVAWKGGLAWKR